MSNRQHALRNIALKLNVSGTIEPLNEQRLYKGSYGFIKLQVYAPETQNTEAPICSAFCTTVDELGRERISTSNYRLWYVGEYAIDGVGYLLFERYLPKEFTEIATQPNGLKITINYHDSAPTLDEDGQPMYYDNGVPKRHATNLLVSSRYTTTVYPGGYNDQSVELDINSAEAAQISENMRNIAELQSDVEGLQNYIEDSVGSLVEANQRITQEADRLDKRIDDTKKGLDERIDEVEAIALSRDNSKVFNTHEEMWEWLSNPANTKTLIKGSNLFVIEAGPDYWWSGTEPIEEWDKTDLSVYYKKDEIEALLAKTRSEIVATYKLEFVVKSTDNSAQNIVTLSKAEYDAIPFKDPNTLYIVPDDVDPDEKTLQDQINDLKARLVILEEIIGGTLK